MRETTLRGQFERETEWYSWHTRNGTIFYLNKEEKAKSKYYMAYSNWLEKKASKNDFDEMQEKLSEQVKGLNDPVPYMPEPKNVVILTDMRMEGKFDAALEAISNAENINQICEILKYILGKIK